MVKGAWSGERKTKTQDAAGEERRKETRGEETEAMGEEETKGEGNKRQTQPTANKGGQDGSSGLLGV